MMEFVIVLSDSRYDLVYTVDMCQEYFEDVFNLAVHFFRRKRETDSSVRFGDMLEGILTALGVKWSLECERSTQTFVVDD